MKARRTWTLAGRMTRWFTVSLTGVVLLVSVPSAWFVWRVVEQELDALLHEELDELSTGFQSSARDEAAFLEVTSSLSAQHPSNRFGWRLWSTDGERVVLETGATSLLPDRSRAPESVARSERLDRDRRWEAMLLPTGQVAELVVDGSAQLTALRRYGVVALILIVGGAAAAIGVSTVLSRRASGLIHEVADRVRAVRSPSEEVDLATEELPEEIRAVAEALREMLTNIQKGAERSRLMTAGLAHELRSPIQNLLGETEVALLFDGTAQEYRAVLHSHTEELRSLGDAVDNLVTLCSVQDERMTVERERFDLAVEAELRLARESAAARRRGVRFALHGRGNTTLLGDRESLLRALRNLAANGVEWTPSGGEVRVDLDGGGEGIVVTVDDGGPGIPEEVRDRIFDPFFRGPTAKGRRAGYGLGLAIVRTATESHGGEIEIGRSPFGGARFRLILPREGRVV